MIIFKKEGFTIEELKNLTAGGVLPSFVLRDNGKPICELYSLDLAIMTAEEYVRTRIECREAVDSLFSKKEKEQIAFIRA